MTEDLKNKIEALLFSKGNKISNEELSRLTRTPIEEIKNAVSELKSDYELKGSSLFITEEGDAWKLSVKEPYQPLVQKIVTETELSRTVMETLAVIAWKAPVLQADIIRIRTNKAYDHIGQLEEAGFLLKQKHGRTMLIKLTDKFFSYFDLKNKEAIKDKFRDFKEVKTAERLEHEEKKEEMLGPLQVIKEKPHSEIVDEPEEETKVEIVDLPKEDKSKEEENDKNTTS